MLSAEIRTTFLKYFEGLGHQVVPSSSLVPAGDPTLFFANAGMNQFKDVFTGQATRLYSRAASSQKCMRVAGKHNDFETVGRSPTHLTFFEMLGNFSFGDYFKAEAIAFAWRLVTEKAPGRLGIDPSRLWVTVFEDDDEAERIWTRDIGVAADRVVRLGAADNYWSMGETGPQGPCSEIFVDFGQDVGCRLSDCNPSHSCGRFLEFWNLVFMQFERDTSGTVRKLPKPSIDTGMGLDRMSAILQGVASVYETDLFQPILAGISKRSGVAVASRDPANEAAFLADAQVSMRVVADHVRAATFLVADGVFPTNDGRGYVLRKLLRRASGHAGRVGIPAPALSELTAIVVETMGQAYPDLRRHAELTRETVRREELSFQATLELGSVQLGEVERRVKAAGAHEIGGAEAFKLHDTYGFPIEYTVETARASGLTVDREGFEALLGEQRERARGAAKAISGPVLGSDVDVAATDFRGYHETRVDGCRVLLLAGDAGPIDSTGGDATGWVVLDMTPFYAESGGQVGDIGRLVAEHAAVVVLDTQWLRPGVIGHRVRGGHGAIVRGDVVRAEVDEGRRRRIMANHTATHLLHAALREVLGGSARQAGSLVAPDRLRFDFTWGEPLTAEQLAEIERRVNGVIFAHRPVGKSEMVHADAMARGAVAMFGEKYGDVVRVVAVDDWSVELCGGTHCDRTEQIGALRILSERGVAAGVRRIEAVTGPGLFDRLVEDEGLLDGIESVLKAPRAELVPAVQRLVENLKSLRRELEDTKRRAAEGSGSSTGRRADVAGVAIETRIVAGLDVTALREMAEGAREKAGVAALALGSSSDGKAALVLALDKDLAARLGGNAARDIVGIMAKEVGGGGGGRAEMGWAGGKRAENLEAALLLLPALLEERLRAGS